MPNSITDEVHQTPPPATAPIERLVLTADEVCAAIGICRVSLWRLGKRNLLKANPHLRHKLYSVAAVKRFVDSGN